MAHWTPENRNQLKLYLSSMAPDVWQRFIQDMIDTTLKLRENAINVESVFARFRKDQGAQKGLIVRNELDVHSFSPPVEPFTQIELEALAGLAMNGVLEVEPLGRGGTKRIKTLVRLVVVMQKQIQSPRGVCVASRRKFDDRAN